MSDCVDAAGQQIKSKTNTFVHVRRILDWFFVVLSLVFFSGFNVQNATFFYGLSSGRFVWDSYKPMHSFTCQHRDYCCVYSIRLIIHSRRRRWRWWFGGGSSRTSTATARTDLCTARNIYTIHADAGSHEMLKIAQVICSIRVVSVHSQNDRINHMAYVKQSTRTGYTSTAILNEIKLCLVSRFVFLCSASNRVRLLSSLRSLDSLCSFDSENPVSVGLG